MSIALIPATPAVALPALSGATASNAVAGAAVTGAAAVASKSSFNWVVVALLIVAGLLLAYHIYLSANDNESEERPAFHQSQLR